MYYTYTSGLTLKAEKDVTKKDILCICEMLSSHPEYNASCHFEPERISEGGIIYKFNDTNGWYKSIRFRNGAKWPWIKDIEEWIDSSDIIFDANTEFTMLLKSFHGAPVFTHDELEIWENILNTIGIKRIGKYPSKKYLKEKGSLGEPRV